MQHIIIIILYCYCCCVLFLLQVYWAVEFSVFIAISILPALGGRGEAMKCGESCREDIRGVATFMVVVVVFLFGVEAQPCVRDFFVAMTTTDDDDDD